MFKSDKRPENKPRKKTSLKLGLEASYSLNRVEGLVVSKDMQRMFRHFEASGMPHEARRAAIRSKYGKKAG
ncbi:hypothetical protein [Aestuariivirga sp.]|uniref:hypothetical protein n=1 Tax=Aestuariivirga sp. TaxID=2650926 RepID=UPI0039E6C9BD